MVMERVFCALVFTICDMDNDLADGGEGPFSAYVMARGMMHAIWPMTRCRLTSREGDILHLRPSYPLRSLNRDELSVLAAPHHRICVSCPDALADPFPLEMEGDLRPLKKSH